jgi:hypothetical protein
MKEKRMNASKLLVGSAAAVIAIGAVSFAGCSADRIKGVETSSTSYDNTKATAQADTNVSDTSLASSNSSGYQPAVNQADTSLNTPTSSDIQSEPAPRATRG